MKFAKLESESRFDDYINIDGVGKVPSPVRQVKLYCVALFATDTGNARVFTFLNMDKCLECSLMFRSIDKGVFVDTFSRTILVMPDHPLYKYSTPIKQ